MSSWSIPIDRWAAKAQGRLEDATRDATIMVFGSVVLNSPVDSGRFRANMNVSYGVPDQTVTYNTDQSRAQSEIQKVVTLPVGGVVFITNALPYAAKLEYGGYPNPPKHPIGKTANGYSIQAPHGMFRLAAAQFNDFVREAVKE